MYRGARQETGSLMEQSRSRMKKSPEQRGRMLDIGDGTEIHSDHADREVREKREQRIISRFLV